MDKLYKLKKAELLDLCKKNNIKTTTKQTKRQLAETYYQNGGRYYKCQGSRKQVEYVESRNNPQNNVTKKYSKNDWVCTETGLTNDQNKRKGCSYELKSGMQCLPCWDENAEKRPKECRACVSGKRVFYCK